MSSTILKSYDLKVITVHHSIVTNIFFFYSQLSSKLDKTIIVYYSINGHGKGPVDAMSGFGVKSVVRRAIVTHDFFYSSAEDLLVFLKKEMAKKVTITMSCLMNC